MLASGCAPSGSEAGPTAPPDRMNAMAWSIVQSVAMMIAVVYVFLNLLADLIVMLLVPKLREPA